MVVPLPPGVGLFVGEDKVAHLLAYFVFALLLWRAYLRGGQRSRAALWVVLITAVHGALAELVQRFVPSRTASVTDWGADLVGAMLAVVGAGLWHRAREPQNQSRPARSD